MDSIPPIAPGSAAISRVGRTPVERLERVARERDRPAKERQERKRRESPSEIQSEWSPEEDDGRPHIDVRV
jgi:hypothetical protein